MKGGWVEGKEKRRARDGKRRCVCVCRMRGNINYKIMHTAAVYDSNPQKKLSKRKSHHHSKSRSRVRHLTG